MIGSLLLCHCFTPSCDSIADCGNVRKVVPVQSLCSKACVYHLDLIKVSVNQNIIVFVEFLYVLLLYYTTDVPVLDKIMNTTLFVGEWHCYLHG